MSSSVYRIGALRCLTAIIIYVLFARLPSGLRCLDAYARASTENRMEYCTPAESLKLPSEWAVVDGLHLSISEDAAHLNRKGTENEWICVNVSKLAGSV